MPTLTREHAAKRFAELPLPSTKDEHWRFTDLRGFDPESVSTPGTRGYLVPQLRPSTWTSPPARSSPSTGSSSARRRRVCGSSFCRATTRRR